MKTEKNDCFGLCSMGRIIQLILRTIRVFSLFLLYPGLSQEASGSENTPGDSSSFIFHLRDQAKILERLSRENGAEVDRMDSVSWVAGRYKQLPIATSDLLSTNNKSAAESAIKETTNFLQKSMSFLAIKTNLLYLAGITPEPDWTGAIPNAEIEWYFGKRWSLNAGVSYAYFRKNNTYHEIRGLSSLSLEPRIWLSDSKRYKGIYAGIYGLTGDFDVKRNELSSDGQTGTFREGGLSLGYYLPFSRHWGAEAGIRVGYRTVDCDRYHCQDSHDYYLSGYTQNDFKLTGFSLLIVYQLGKNRNQLK